MKAPSAHSQRTLCATTPKTGSTGVITAVNSATSSATPISTTPGGVISSPDRRVVAGPVDQPEAWAGAEALREQLGPLEGTGTVFVDLEGIVFAEPYSWALMAELARRDIPFLVAGDGDVRQVGDNRRFDGGADVRLFYRTGPEAAVVPPGATARGLRFGVRRRRRHRRLRRTVRRRLTVAAEQHDQQRHRSEQPEAVQPVEA